MNDALAGQGLQEPKTLTVETPEQRELRQQVAYLGRQRDIFKKACGILSAAPACHQRAPRS